MSPAGRRGAAQPIRGSLRQRIVTAKPRGLARDFRSVILTNLPHCEVDVRATALHRI